MAAGSQYSKKKGDGVLSEIDTGAGGIGAGLGTGIGMGIGIGLGNGMGLGGGRGRYPRNMISGMSAYKSSKESILERMNSTIGIGVVKPEDIEMLEEKCLRMIFEKEDKYINNEEKLKAEEKDILNLESELKNMEMKMKEKAQENNLLDFKLRDMARNNDIENGFLKPHSGIHSGILSGVAGASILQTIQL